jgi:tetratricopeptide (TPR) repeat protein
MKAQYKRYVKGCVICAPFIFILFSLSASSCNSNKEKERLIERADHFASRNEYWSAYPLYLKAHKIDERDERVNRNLGAIAYKTSEYRDAITFLTLAIAKDSETHSFNYRGFSYLKLDKSDSAIADFKMALKLDPNNIEPLLGLAIGEMSMHDFKNSEFHIRELLARNEKNPITMKSPKATMYQIMGSVMGQTNRLDSSMIYFQYAINIDSQEIYVYAARGTILKGVGRLDDALKDFMKMRTLNPRVGKSYEEIANIYIMEGKFKKACEMVDSAKKLGAPISDSTYSKYCK